VEGGVDGGGEGQGWEDDVRQSNWIMVGCKLRGDGGGWAGGSRAAISAWLAIEDRQGVVCCCTRWAHLSRGRGGEWIVLHGEIEQGKRPRGGFFCDYSIGLIFWKVYRVSHFHFW
jgi:hypothetical protein